MKALLLTNEYPPNVYGGAGVHVEYLSRELAKLIDVEVRCFGEQEEDTPSLKVRGTTVDSSRFADADSRIKPVLNALAHSIDFNIKPSGADVVHCHTWYSHFGGIAAKLAYGIPLVITAHSLEPLRPWKREQLGGGYDFSSWIEKTALEMADAVIAVSKETKADVLNHFDVDESKIEMIYNGIDTEQYHCVDTQYCFAKYGIDPEKPYVLFVGRITRQKGIVHLVNAIQYIDPECQVVLCAGAPDTPEIAKEMSDAVDVARKIRDGIIWIEEMVTKEIAIELYSNAAIFCCPSIYEPFGIINLEAMACETPVVASAVGGIKEVVVHGETGLLVPVEQLMVAPFEPVDPEKFSGDLAEAVNSLIADPELCKKMGAASRARAVDTFSWTAIAEQTADLYRKLSEAKS
ncbi:MAG: glycogen synthase [Kiritimatiellales bacterium]|nr:glycogen synthase [Kiritimatiellales bacterium]